MKSGSMPLMFCFFAVQDIKIDDYVPAPSTEQFSGMKISTDPADSVVPYTQGTRRRKAEQVSYSVKPSGGVCYCSGWGGEDGEVKKFSGMKIRTNPVTALSTITRWMKRRKAEQVS